MTMTMTITSPVLPGAASVAGTGIAPASQPGASEDFLLTGIVGGQPAPAGVPAGIALPGVPADSAAPAQLFAHVMEAANEADATQAKPAAAAVKDQADTATATAVDPAGLLAALAGNLAAPAPVPTPPATPAPVAADGAVGAAAGATLHPSATPFNLRAAGIAVTTPPGAAPQASYTALQDANQLALAQQAARVAHGTGPSARTTYVDASAVTPSNPPPGAATAEAKADVNAPLAATGSAAAPGATIGTAYPASAAQAIAATTTTRAVPGAPAGLDKLFNPALATNAALPERQAGAASMTTTTASADTVAASATTTAIPVASPAATVAMATTAATTGPAAPAVAPPAAAMSLAAATGQYITDRKPATAAVTNAALPIRAITGAASAAMAGYPAVADAPQPRVTPAPAGASAGADWTVAAAPMAANSASGSGTARDDGQAAGKFASALATTAGATAPAVAAAAPMATGFTAPVKLAGAPEQWQQPLREALGDRLQVNLQRNSNQAVIRLDPPNMGSIEISIRQSAGALQVNLSASNSEVVRQLNAIGDTVRQDLATRQFSDVAVTVSTARTPASTSPQQSFAQAQPDGSRQQQEQQEQRARTPGRALHQEAAVPTFAMYDQE